MQIVAQNGGSCVVRWPKTIWKTFGETTRQSRNRSVKAYLVTDDDDDDDDV
jgi:hypothetical protein